MRVGLSWGLVVAFLMGMEVAGYGQAPANDLCSAATVIPQTGPFPYLTPLVDLTNATDSQDPVPGDPCQTNVTRGVWYRFTPTLASLYRFTTCDSLTQTTEEDTVMVVYEGAGGCNGTLTPLACADDTCRRQAEVFVSLAAGVRYYVLIWQYDSGLEGAGSVQLRVDRYDPPANETCATALPLLLDVPVIGSTLLAKNDYELDAVDCFAGLGQNPSRADHRDVVYGFVAPEAGEYSFRVAGYSGGDLVLYLAGSCPAEGGGLPALVTDCIGAANRASAGASEEILEVSLGASEVVYLFVDEQLRPARPSNGGLFRLEVTRSVREMEPNDFPQTATPFVCNVVGSIESDFDQDFYYLGMLPPGARVFAIVDGESSPQTDYDLRVTTDTDVLEFDNSDNDGVFGNFSPNIAGTPMEGGPAYALVTYNVTGPGFPGMEPYHLHAVVQPPIEVAAVESEPNDVLAQADNADLNYHYGNLPGPSPSADVDLFGFEATVGDRVFLSADGDPARDDSPVDLALALLDSSGNTLLAVDTFNSPPLSSTNRNTFFFGAVFPFSPGEALVYRVLRTGTYYAQVRAGVGAGTHGEGDYLLSISRNCVQGGSGQHEAPVFLTVDRLPGNFMSFSLSGSPGATYRIESSGELRVWETSGYATANGAGVIQYQDTAAPAGATLFYRAVWP